MATNVIEFYFYDFSESLPYVWAHEVIFCTTSLVGQIINRRLVTTVLEQKRKPGA